MASIIRFEGRDFPVAGGQSVLDALLAGDAVLDWSCRKGICQSCVARRTDGGPVPASAQGELKPTLREQRCFLACRWFPDTDAEIERLDANRLFSPATVAGIEQMSADVCRVLLDPNASLYYHAGQFINLRGPDDLVRSYSLASVPAQDPLLELHVKRLHNGRVSGWVHENLRVGQQVAFDGPHGSCFYLPGSPEQPLLLIATGTGAAPLWGIARDALRSGHRGAVHFYHGARKPEDLYLHAELGRFAGRHAAFHYHPAVTDADAVADGVRTGRVSALALADIGKLAGWRVFLCGNPEMVQSTRKRAYLAGAALADILVDPFELVDLRRTPR